MTAAITQDLPMLPSNAERPAPMSEENLTYEDRARRKQPPLQFGLSSMLVATTALALVFAALKWLGLPPGELWLVLLVLVVSVPAAIGLLAAIAGSQQE